MRPGIGSTGGGSDARAALPGRYLAIPVAIILVATLFPGGVGPPLIPACFNCGGHPLSDALLNLALYLPFGAVGVLAGLRPWKMVLAAGLLSGSIELTQLGLLPGREGTLSDVVFNVSGAVLGWGLVWSSRWWLGISRVRAARLSALASLVLPAAVLSTGYLAEPDLPRSRYYGQWAARFGDMEWYQGRVLEASLGGVAVPSTALGNSGEVRSLLLSGADLHVRLIAGPAPGSLAPIFSIADDQQQRIFLLGAEEDDLVVWLRARASALMLDQPDIRAPGLAAGAVPGDTVEATVSATGEGVCLGFGERTACGLGLTAGAGWGYLLYIGSLPRWLRISFNGLWLALLVFPAGFWARMSWESAVGGLVLLVGLLLAPGLAGLQPTSMAEHAGAIFGLLAGVSAGRASRRSGVGRAGGVL